MYIGRLSNDNPQYRKVEYGSYFIYDKWDYMGNWVGYQVGLKASNGLGVIRIDLATTKLHDAEAKLSFYQNKQK